MVHTELDVSRHSWKIGGAGVVIIDGDAAWVNLANIWPSEPYGGKQIVTEAPDEQEWEEVEEGANVWFRAGFRSLRGRVQYER